MLERLDLDEGDSPVAVFVPWRGSATFQRLDGFCRGVADGLCAPCSRSGHPLVLAGDGDVGGLIGIHCREELKLDNPIVSIDGLELKEFDYIDIGAHARDFRRRAGGHQVADLPDERRRRQGLEGGTRRSLPRPRPPDGRHKRHFCSAHKEGATAAEIGSRAPAANSFGGSRRDGT